ELLSEVGSTLDGAPQELEGVVIPSPLQDLGDEALDAAAATRERRVEEDEPRPLRRLRYSLAVGLREARHGCSLPTLRGLNLQSGGALGRDVEDRRCRG